MKEGENNPQSIDPKAYEELEQLGCTIHWFRDGEYELPKTFDLSVFPEEEKQYVGRKLCRLSAYIEKPAIEEWFDNHEARYRWRMSLSDPLRKAYGNNRLRENHFGLVGVRIRHIQRALVQQGDLRNLQLEEIHQEIFSAYEKGLYERKTVQFADLVAEGAFQVLEMFAETEAVVESIDCLLPPVLDELPRREPLMPEEPLIETGNADVDTSNYLTDPNSASG